MSEPAPRRLKGASYAETRSAILDLVRSSETTSRVDLAQRSGLTEVTIAKIVKELLAEGLIIEAGRGKSTGGKRPTLLTLNTGVLYAIGISLDASGAVLTLCGLNGMTVDRLVIDIRDINRPAEVLDLTASSIQLMLDRHTLQRSAIVGVGVASTGRRRGALGWGPFAPEEDVWDSVDTAVELTSRCELPVIVENDANCVALGAFWAGGNDSPANFIAVYMATGIGAGIVINGSIFRGASDNAGEIGHTVIEPDGLPCWCGLRGCLSTVGSPQGIVRQVHAEPGLIDLFDAAGLDERQTYDRVIAAYRAGLPEATALVELSVRQVTTVLLGLANALDLERILLAGPGFAAAGDRYAVELRSLAAKAAFSRTVHPLVVELGGTTSDVAAVGAASVVLHGHLTPHHVAARS